MKYSVKKYNDFFFDIYVREFNLMRLGVEQLAIDIPADKPLNVSARQAHKGAEKIMSALSGTWYLGRLRLTDHMGNYVRTATSVTRTDLDDSDFTADHVLIAQNGEITINEFELIAE